MPELREQNDPVSSVSVTTRNRRAARRVQDGSCWHHASCCRCESKLGFQIPSGEDCSDGFGALVLLRFWSSLRPFCQKGQWGAPSPGLGILRVCTECGLFRRLQQLWSLTSGWFVLRLQCRTSSQLNDPRLPRRFQALVVVKYWSEFMRPISTQHLNEHKIAACSTAHSIRYRKWKNYR